MAGQHLSALSAMDLTPHKKEAVRLAKAQEKIVYDRCQRSNIPMPDYAFDELIGKGSFGRVYKGRKSKTQELVAIKVIDIDDADYRAVRDSRDDQIKEFNREIQVLKQAQDSGAKNMNQMLEAFAIHSQLWLICEYCPGGSVKTLMRATKEKLGEEYIIPIARELAVGLHALHQAGIVHRDIKAANVLIHEEGHLQLCDFGVAGVLQSTQDKRTTIIGTLHWMAPEMYQQDAEYSSEVDVWGYGCTLYECAVGNPPNADVREIHQIRSRLRRNNAPISLPESGNFSKELDDLVKFTLNRNPNERPTMEHVLNHAYIENTAEKYPTASLSELVKVYYEWIHGGGQRMSLYNPHGAKEAEASGTVASDQDEWNFSTTDFFDKRVSMMMNPTPSLKIETDNTPKQSLDLDSAPDLAELTLNEKANFEERVRRGAPLTNIFDQDQPEYKYETKSGDFVPIEEKPVSDLPLRTLSEDRPYSIASNVIDMGDFDMSHYAPITTTADPTIKLADAATIRANRSNSKLYRESSTENLTAKHASAEDLYTSETESNKGERPVTKDFSFPPKEWTMPTSSSTEPKVAAEETPSTAPPLSKATKHATMEWSFASAMASASDTEPEPIDDPPPVEPAPAPTAAKAAKHATMEWSFSSAMAAAATTDDEPPTSETTTIIASPPAPHRPPLLHTATEPIFAAHDVEILSRFKNDLDISSSSSSRHQHPSLDFDSSRPSTATSMHSAAVSDLDYDPFKFDIPTTPGDDSGAAYDSFLTKTLPPAMDALGIEEYQNGHVLDTSAISGGGDPSGEPLWDYYANIPETSIMPNNGLFPAGVPVRIGEEGFPGSKVPSVIERMQHAQNGDGGGGVDGAVDAAALARSISFPEILPPSTEAMMEGASNEAMEAELGRLLGGFGDIMKTLQDVWSGMAEGEEEDG